ncbi:MAG TPA: ISAzo13 family transposase [Beijerinckiaceae bacterium]|nr:ISAzo13 family transposase [Beijerinckiaceae bacterium]
MIRVAQVRAAQKRYREMAPVLDEQSRRRFVALEAQTLGHGGVSLMERISGLSRSTIYRGRSDIRHKASAPAGRVRKPGGGRKRKAVQDATLIADLKRLVAPATRGDPMRPLLWTTRSLRNLSKELANDGHQVCPTVVGDLLRRMGYSLQANRKTREGDGHIDRDAQFQYINTQAVAFLEAQQPIISVDTKKKELVGNFKNNGRDWRPAGAPELVNVHDFIDPKLSRAVPYGIYDINNNVGWVSVGTDHDTASFAVNAIRRWWRAMGRQRYPKARRLMITADGGDSNGYRVRLWKVELQKLAGEIRLPITICHLPPGTSKWNKVEHRLFSFISINWRGKPLRSYRTIVQLIAATTTDTGLTVRAELDENKYPKGVKVSDAQLPAVNLAPHSFHGEWNYTISPIGKRSPGRIQTV